MHGGNDTIQERLGHAGQKLGVDAVAPGTQPKARLVMHLVGVRRTIGEKLDLVQSRAVLQGPNSVTLLEVVGVGRIQSQKRDESMRSVSQDILLRWSAEPWVQGRVEVVDQEVMRQQRDPFQSGEKGTS